MAVNSEKRIEADNKRKFVAIVVPPIPLSCSIETVPEEGITFRMLAPVDGKINDLITSIGAINKDNVKEVDIALKRYDSQGVMVYCYKVKVGSKIMNNLGIDVKKGDRLDIDVSTPASLVLIAFNIEPTISSANYRNYIVEEPTDAGV